jgi:hypothetical protein
VHFTCADVRSGIPTATCPGDQLLTGEGSAVSSMAQTVADTAGNTTSNFTVPEAGTLDLFGIAGVGGTSHAFL